MQLICQSVLEIDGKQLSVRKVWNVCYCFPVWVTAYSALQKNISLLEKQTTKKKDIFSQKKFAIVMKRSYFYYKWNSYFFSFFFFWIIKESFPDTLKIWEGGGINYWRQLKFANHYFMKILLSSKFILPSLFLFLCKEKKDFWNTYKVKNIYLFFVWVCIYITILFTVSSMSYLLTWSDNKFAVWPTHGCHFVYFLMLIKFD